MVQVAFVLFLFFVWHEDSLKASKMMYEKYPRISEMKIKNVRKPEKGQDDEEYFYQSCQCFAFFFFVSAVCCHGNCCFVHFIFRLG